MKDEIRKSENKILKFLKSLSGNQVPDDRNGGRAEITSDGENTIFVQFASHGLDLDQEDIDPREFFVGAHPNLHDLVKRVSEGNFLRERKTRLTSQPTRTNQRQLDIEIHQLAQAVARPDCQQKFNYRPTPKTTKALTARLSTIDGRTEKLELFEHLSYKSLEMYQHLTEEEKVDSFLSLMQGDVLQNFVNIRSPQKKNINEILAIYSRRFVGTKLMTSARKKWQTMMFDPTKHKLDEFFDELQKTLSDRKPRL